MKKETLKESFIDLRNRILHQVAETMWEIERIKESSDEELEDFTGPVDRTEIMIETHKQLIRRHKNYRKVEAIINQTDIENIKVGSDKEIEKIKEQLQSWEKKKQKEEDTKQSEN